MQENYVISPQPLVLTSASKVRAFGAAQQEADKKLALVPTMGALHDGHIELVRQAQALADKVMVSIFVNPAQFGPQEDLAAYPRSWQADLKKLTKAGAAAVFYPEVATIYPEGFTTMISVGAIAAPLEGVFRPGHFDGVATVVAKLLNLCRPDLALFGEKDWQQLQVIRRMVADLNIPSDIVGVPTVRDEHGLAMSSRNAYLSPEQLAVARRLNVVLFAVAGKLRVGMAPAQAQSWGEAELVRAGFDVVDYLAICDARTLTAPGADSLRVLAAVRIGKARLIDNVAV